MGMLYSLIHEFLGYSLALDRFFYTYIGDVGRVAVWIVCINSHDAYQNAILPTLKVIRVGGQFFGIVL
jgi:hypothetical protein